ncbi:MAG: hypothetical protein ABFD20_07325 [Anaerolineales bacterium]
MEHRSILVTLTVRREGDLYVSECVQLGTASCGASPQEALDNIREATLLYLNTLEELGICEETLAQRGVPLFAEQSDPQPLHIPSGVDAYASVLPLDCVTA